MKRQTVFHLISEITRQAGVSCILIGGFAVNYHKVTRQTADVDFLITKDDFNKISNFLEKAGYKQTSLHENFIQLESSQPYLMDVDFMFVERETFERMQAEGERLDISGRQFVVPSLAHLIALKLHAIKHNPEIRIDRDLPDILNLIRINKVDVNDNQFKELCLKYGTEEIYRRIRGL